jgi:transcriptional regulator with XRE-family HTH domain
MKGTEADSLREWFASQKEFKTWRDLARYLGVDHRTLSKYKTGRKPVSNPDHRSLLHKATLMEAFSKPYQPMKESHRREAERGRQDREACA